MGGIRRSIAIAVATVLPVGLFAAIVALHRQPLPEGVEALPHLRSIARVAEEPPKISRTDWRHVRLPDDWSSRDGRPREIWYAGTFDLPELPSRLHALYLPSVTQNAAVWLNGRFVGSGGSFGDPISRNWSRPLLFPLTARVIRKGTNVIDLRVRADVPGQGYLDAAIVGPEEALRPLHDRVTFVRVTALWTIAGVMIVSATILGWLGLRWRRDPVYLWFSALAFTWAAMTLSVRIVDPPISDQAWNLFRYWIIGWSIGLIIPFVNAFLRDRQPRLEKALFVVGVAASVLLAVAAAISPEALHFAGTSIWDPALLVLGLHPTFRIIGALRARDDTEAVFLLGSGILVFLCGGHDLLGRHRLLGLGGDGYYLPWGGLVVLVVFLAILVDRFVRSLRESEAWSRELERRVEDKRLELERNHERLRSLELERVRARERERLVQDVHDGIGGQLVSALAVAERGDGSIVIAAALRDALAELRLLIDSLSVSEADAGSILGVLRERLERLLRAGGVDLVWEVRDTPSARPLDPDESVHVARLVQESCTNVLKHAGARTVTIRASEDEGRPYLLVRDDGCGIDHGVREGRGLPGMRTRAASIGGTLEIRGRDSGTEIRLWLPTERPEAVDGS